MRFRAAHARITAVVAASVVACSSGIDGYHLVGGSGAKGTESDASSDGGTSSGGSSGTGDVGEGGSDAMTVLVSGGGDAGDGSSDGGASGSGGKMRFTVGGAGGGGEISAGGTSAGGAAAGGAGAGGANAGGTNSGGAMSGGAGGVPVGSGGAATGGAGAGGKVGSGGTGTGGTGSGGAGTGGAGTGGKVGSGGTGTGGTGSGGAGTGGMGTGGMPATGPADPTLVIIAGLPSGITAAAWVSPRFFLLQSGSNAFYAVNPATQVVQGPFKVPSGSVAPYAFGASSDSVYVIIGSKVYRVPQAGSTSQAGVTITQPTAASGAYANGFFMIGDTSNSGTENPQLYSDASGTVTADKIGAVWAVATDGSNFGFSTRSTSDNLMRINGAVASASPLANSTGCTGGGTGETSNPVSIHGQTVAFVKGAGAFHLLSFGTIASGTCSVTNAITFGDTSGPTPVGLVDDDHAMVLEDYASGIGHAIIRNRDGTKTAVVQVSFGSASNPKAIIVGGAHYAVIVAGTAPQILQF